MAENIQWIKLKVGMFDGNSFKKIKRAKIGGVSYRDKLTAVWFELMDLAGKSNSNGFLIDNNEIPYRTFEDIAVMLDREEKEIELCMKFFLNEQMIEIINDIFCLSNFMKYQNQEGLDKIREQKRIAQSKWRERKRLGLIANVDEKTSTPPSTNNLLSQENKNKEQDISKLNNLDNKKQDIRTHAYEGVFTFEDYKQRFSRFYEFQKTPKYVEMANSVIEALVEMEKQDVCKFKQYSITHEQLIDMLSKVNEDLFTKTVVTLSFGEIENVTTYVWGILFNTFFGGKSVEVLNG